VNLEKAIVSPQENTHTHTQICTPCPRVWVLQRHKAHFQNSFCSIKNRTHIVTDYKETSLSPDGNFCKQEKYFLQATTEHIFCIRNPGVALFVGGESVSA
jgi:hypothetical protein